MKTQSYDWSWVGWCLLVWVALFYFVASSMGQGYFTMHVFGVECGLAHIKSSTLWIYGGELVRVPVLSPLFVIAAVLAGVVFGAGLSIKKRLRKEPDA